MYLWIPIDTFCYFVFLSVHARKHHNHYTLIYNSAVPVQNALIQIVPVGTCPYGTGRAFGKG